MTFCDFGVNYTLLRNPESFKVDV